MEGKAGCIMCHKTNTRIGYTEFTNIIGKRYQVYFCHTCFKEFNGKIDRMTEAQKVNECQRLEAIINKKLVY